MLIICTIIVGWFILGTFANFFTTNIVIGHMLDACEDNVDLCERLFTKNYLGVTSRDVDSRGYSKIRGFVLTQLFWPWNVDMLLKCLQSSVVEAKDILRDENSD